ncbi:hypothetical protein EDC04DRAFT_88905 [Pisolithus marmoratus]|nr:hypothetical protein EDC04DRAFT_88905 [Pisolithus marmoratus]
MVESRHSQQLQNLTSSFIHTMKDTEREWRSTHMTMAKKCGEYRAALLAEQRTTLAMMLLGGGRRYFYVLEAITGVMRLVLADMNSTIEWWASISDRAGTWGDVTRQPMSGNDLNDYVRGESASVIRALGSYREVYQNVSQELRRSSESSAGSDGGYCEVDKSQAALLPTTDYLVGTTPSHSKLRRGYSPRSQPPPVESKGVNTTPSSSITL